MSHYWLNWPGLEAIPVSIVDPGTKTIYTLSNPVPRTKAHLLTRSSCRYVQLRHLVELLGGGEPQLIDICRRYPNHNALEGLVSLDTLVVFVFLFPSECSGFQLARTAVLKFLQLWTEHPCMACGFINRDCKCGGRAVRAITDYGALNDVRSAHTQTDISSQQLVYNVQPTDNYSQDNYTQSVLIQPTDNYGQRVLLHPSDNYGQSNYTQLLMQAAPQQDKNGHPSLYNEPQAQVSQGEIGPLSQVQMGHVTQLTLGHLPQGQLGLAPQGQLGPISQGQLGPISQGRLFQMSQGQLGQVSQGQLGLASQGQLGPISQGQLGQTSQVQPLAQPNAYQASAGPAPSSIQPIPGHPDAAPGQPKADSRPITRDVAVQTRPVINTTTHQVKRQDQAVVVTVTTTVDEPQVTKKVSLWRLLESDDDEDPLATDIIDPNKGEEAAGTEAGTKDKGEESTGIEANDKEESTGKEAGTKGKEEESTGTEAGTKDKGEESTGIEVGTKDKEEATGTEAGTKANEEESTKTEAGPKDKEDGSIDIQAEPKDKEESTGTQTGPKEKGGESVEIEDMELTIAEGHDRKKEGHESTDEMIKEQVPGTKEQKEEPREQREEPKEQREEPKVLELMDVDHEDTQLNPEQNGDEEGSSRNKLNNKVEPKDKWGELTESRVELANKTAEYTNIVEQIDKEEGHTSNSMDQTGKEEEHNKRVEQPEKGAEQPEKGAEQVNKVAVSNEEAPNQIKKPTEEQKTNPSVDRVQNMARRWCFKFEYTPTKEQIYKCTFSRCGLCFDSLAAARFHDKVHGAFGLESHNALMCFCCSYNVPFNRWFDLLRHLKVTHARSMAVTPLHCYLCGIGFKSEGELHVHQDYHYMGNLKCVRCGLTCFSNAQLVEHLSGSTCSSSGSLQYGCPYCSLVFHIREMRDLHVRSHSDPGLVCCVCQTETGGGGGGGKVWSNWKDLRKHYQQKHKTHSKKTSPPDHTTHPPPDHTKTPSARGTPSTKKATPSATKKSTPAPAKKSAPIPTTRKYPCHVCTEAFRSHDDYTYHMIKKHNFIPYVLSVCQFCDKTFKTSKMADYHVRNTHGDAVKCQQCDFLARSHQVLKTHVASVHSPAHVCTECGQGFSLYTQLRRHMAHHALHQVLPCRLCGMEFRSHRQLKDHMATVHPTKTLECPECPYTTTKTSSLQEHVMKHHPQFAAELEEEEREPAPPVVETKEPAPVPVKPVIPALEEACRAQTSQPRPRMVRKKRRGWKKKATKDILMERKERQKEERQKQQMLIKKAKLTCARVRTITQHRNEADIPSTTTTVKKRKEPPSVEESIPPTKRPRVSKYGRSLHKKADDIYLATEGGHKPKSSSDTWDVLPPYPYLDHCYHKLHLDTFPTDMREDIVQEVRTSVGVSGPEESPIDPMLDQSLSLDEDLIEVTQLEHQDLLQDIIESIELASEQVTPVYTPQATPVHRPEQPAGDDELDFSPEELRQFLLQYQWTDSLNKSPVKIPSVPRVIQSSPTGPRTVQSSPTGPRTVQSSPTGPRTVQSSPTGPRTVQSSPTGPRTVQPSPTGPRTVQSSPTGPHMMPTHARLPAMRTHPPMVRFTGTGVRIRGPRVPGGQVYRGRFIEPGQGGTVVIRHQTVNRDRGITRHPVHHRIQHRGIVRHVIRHRVISSEGGHHVTNSGEHHVTNSGEHHVTNSGEGGHHVINSGQDDGGLNDAIYDDVDDM